MENKHFFILALVCVIFSEATMQRCFLSWVFLNNKRNLWKISAKGKKEVIFSNVAGPFVSLTKTLYLTGFCSELASFLGISLSSCLCVFLCVYVIYSFYGVIMNGFTKRCSFVLFVSSSFSDLFTYYVMAGSLFDWYYHGVSHNQHKVWIKAFQICLKKFIMRENIFARIAKFT